MTARHDPPSEPSAADRGPFLEPVGNGRSAGARMLALFIGLALVAGVTLSERWREGGDQGTAGGDQLDTVGRGLAQPSPAPPSRPPMPFAVPTHRPRASFEVADARAEALHEAVGLAAAAAGDWGVGGLVSPVRAQLPGSAPLDPALLGPTCDGGRLLTAEQVVVVGYRGRRPTGASVARLADSGPPVELDAIVELDAVDGAALIAPLGDRVWRPGYYVVQLERALRSSKRPPLRRLVFCIGMYEPNGALMVPRSIARPKSD